MTSKELVKRGEQVLLLLQANTQNEQLEQALQDLLDESARIVSQPLGKPRRGHFLCELLEQAALALQDLLDAPGGAIEEIVDSLTAHWLPRAIFRTALKSLLDVAMNTGPTGMVLKTMHLQMAGAAIVLCPEHEQHPSLDSTCATPLTKAGVSHGLITGET